MPAKDGKQDLGDFLTELTAEEETLKARLKSDVLGLALRTSLNELDWQNYKISQQMEPTKELHEQHYLMSMGLTRVVGLMLDLHPTFRVPTITLRRRDAPLLEVLEIAACLGFIQHGRRIAQLVRSGLCQLVRSRIDQFDFILPEKLIDYGALERDIEEHYRAENWQFLHEILEHSQQGKSLLLTIESLLKENVFVFREHYMGYHADPTLDEHFFRLAWHDLQNTHGYDSFNELKRFGDIPWLKYLLGAAYLNSLCLKHERFCAAMIMKEPQIRLEDILTISADRGEFVATMRDALNIIGMDFRNYRMTSLEETWKIYEVLAITRRNVELLSEPAAPLPCIIEFSESAIVKLVSGRHSQMDFLLNSLKHTYPRDYDTHQSSRESSMQRALNRLFSPSFEGIETRMNTRLRINGRVLTDVDYAIIDRRFGEVFLFQLKYQDRPGADLRAEFSKTRRFREEVAFCRGAMADSWGNERSIRCLPHPSWHQAQENKEDYCCSAPCLSTCQREIGQ